MKKYILFLFIALFSFSSFAQEEPEYEVFDVIYRKEGGAIKGEILSFDEASGTIVFKDRNGNKYTFGREDYTHFRENERFEVRKKKERVLKERKNNELAFEAGFYYNYLTLDLNFTEDDYLINGDNNYWEAPLFLKLAGGKFLDEKNFIGGTFEYAISLDGDDFYSLGARYKHYYDAGNNNLGLYIPVELKYSAFSGPTNLAVNDTLFEPDGSYSWPLDLTAKAEFAALNLTLGHGFSVILDNKKYLNLELYVNTLFALKEEYDVDFDLLLDDDFSALGYGAALTFGF
ncbi:MAG: hypothetical protein AAF487_00720 [Bacteroidota bacterium]